MASSKWQYTWPLSENYSGATPFRLTQAVGGKVSVKDCLFKSRLLGAFNFLNMLRKTSPGK